MSVQVGEKIPDTLGKNQDGKEISLKQFAGKKLVLYFYPKDNTSGCTAEACSFRDYHSKLRALGYEVVGVSVDSEQSHQKFIEKQQLSFDLIADVEKKLVQLMGVWGEKSMYGRKYMGTFRTTFVINEQGMIERIFSPKEIKTSSHAQQVIEEMTR
jgi:peroxiredoxin Q/BCP